MKWILGNHMLEYIYVLSIALIFHAYIGYPLSLYMIGLFKSRKIFKVLHYPHVTLIITAHNEENKIEKKLENAISLKYKKDKLQIILVSDGSIDNTIKLAEKYIKDGIEIISIEKRGGKENAQKEALIHSKGEIVVFTDAATLLDPSGIEQIVSNFSDPTVGCVSSEDRIIGKDGKPSGEGFYVKYEMWLRRLETKVNSLVGLSGSFFAARKSVCKDFSGDMQSDFRILLNSVKMGLRGICDSNALGYYMDIARQDQEFGRKVRTVLRGMTVYFLHIEFLNIFRYGIFSYQYFCHKLLRWLVPIFLCSLLLSNAILSFNNFIFSITFIVQILFYGIAISGLKIPYLSSYTIIKVPAYFLSVNISIFVAWWRYLRGQRVIMWTPSER